MYFPKRYNSQLITVARDIGIIVIFVRIFCTPHKEHVLYNYYTIEFGLVS